MVMTLPALMIMMEVLWSQIGKRMQSLYFVNWIVMTMDWNMIEALSLTAQQISSPRDSRSAFSPSIFLPLSPLFPFYFQAFHPLPSSHSSTIHPFFGVPLAARLGSIPFHSSHDQKGRANNRACELPLFPFLSSFCPQGFHSTPIISHYSSFSFFLFFSTVSLC